MFTTLLDGSRSLRPGEQSDQRSNVSGAANRLDILLGFVCPGSYLTLTVEPVLPLVISASDASHVLRGESPGVARGRVLGSCHGGSSK